MQIYVSGPVALTPAVGHIVYLLPTLYTETYEDK